MEIEFFHTVERSWIGGFWRNFDQHIIVADYTINGDHASTENNYRLASFDMSPDYWISSHKLIAGTAVNSFATGDLYYLAIYDKVWIARNLLLAP